jgi:hypothetical protein
MQLLACQQSASWPRWSHPLKPWQYLQARVTSLEEVRPTLWNEGIGAASYAGDSLAFRTAILEQYKLYVEMADRVSARRNLANTFFLTLNTAVFAAIGALAKTKVPLHSWLLLLPVLGLVVQCGAWFFLVRSYRQLNSAKFVVIGVLEEQLPASPYWRAEWRALGEGRDKTKYWPLSHLEQWVPVLFAVAYVAGFIVAMAD